jgi:hypothetical protein
MAKNIKGSETKKESHISFISGGTYITIDDAGKKTFKKLDSIDRQFLQAYLNIDYIGSDDTIDISVEQAYKLLDMEEEAFNHTWDRREKQIKHDKDSGLCPKCGTYCFGECEY